MVDVKEQTVVKDTIRRLKFDHSFSARGCRIACWRG
jgi:hypothetical protein